MTGDLTKPPGDQPNKPELWLTDVVLAFRTLEPDGTVWLQNVYDWIRRNRSSLPPNFAAAIRATIYHHSSDSKAYISGNPDAFRKVAHGGWRLRFSGEEAPSKSADLRIFVLSKMTIAELESFVGRGDAIHVELDRRAEEVRKRFGIS